MALSEPASSKELKKDRDASWATAVASLAARADAWDAYTAARNAYDKKPKEKK